MRWFAIDKKRDFGKPKIFHQAGKVFQEARKETSTMRRPITNCPAILVTTVIGALLVLACYTNALAQKAGVAMKPAIVSQQPLFAEYKGVRLGMTPAEVQTRLGKPEFADAELNYFVISPTETVQIGYDATTKVKAISIDYQNGAGAPEPMQVVGTQLETKDDGSRYKVVRYEGLGFWVSYNRTAGPVVTISITIQKM
jgi:hypothetical protein